MRVGEGCYLRRGGQGRRLHSPLWSLGPCAHVSPDQRFPHGGDFFAQGIIMTI